MCLVEEQLGKTTEALIRNIFGQVYEMLTACRGRQREEYLFPSVRGERICAFGITEPEAGSDAASIRTTAVRDGDDYVLNGSKHFISDGDIADFAVVMALTDPEKRARGGITLFLVDRDSPGYRVGRVQPMMGHLGCNHAELVFEDCRVGADKIPRGAGRGLSPHHEHGLAGAPRAHRGPLGGHGEPGARACAPPCGRTAPVRAADRGVPDGAEDARGTWPPTSSRPG